MARRKLTVDRHEEIKRRLADGRSLREIATAWGCSRRLVRQIRDGERLTHETAASRGSVVDVAARMAGDRRHLFDMPTNLSYLLTVGRIYLAN
jgi:Homeodomain-like domain